MTTDSFNHQLESAFPFIRSLDHDDRHNLLAQCRHSVLPAGTIIMNEDIKCSGVTLIVNGLVRIYKLSDEGREVTLYRIGRGETCVLTIACLLGSGTIPYPVSAVTEHDTLMAIAPLELFRRIFQKEEAARNFVFSAMAAKFYTVLGLVENITFKRTNERLLDLLISKTGGGAYPLYATHEAIASELGTAREVVSRLLKEFELNGMLKLQRGKVTLLALTSPPSGLTKAEDGTCMV